MFSLCMFSETTGVDLYFVFNIVNPLSFFSFFLSALLNYDVFVTVF